MEKGNNLENGLLLVLKTYWDLVMDYTIKSFVAAQPTELPCIISIVVADQGFPLDIIIRKA
jgi:hypothetical protein